MSDLLTLAEQSAPTPPEEYRAETSLQTLIEAESNDARAHAGIDRLRSAGTTTRKVTFRKRGRVMSSTFTEPTRPELLQVCARAASKLKGLTREEREDIAAETAIKIARRIGTWEPTRRQLAHVYVWGVVQSVVRDQTAWRATRADATVETNPLDEDSAPILALADPFRADLPTVGDFSADEIADELALSDNARAALVAALSGYGSAVEAGNAWGIGQAAADKRLSRGRAELRGLYPHAGQLLTAIETALAGILREDRERDRPALEPCERHAGAAVDNALLGTPQERRARMLGAIRSAYAAEDIGAVKRLVRAPLTSALGDPAKDARHRSRMLATDPRGDRTPGEWATAQNYGSRARGVLAHIDRMLALPEPATHTARGATRTWGPLPVDPSRVDHDPVLSCWAQTVRHEAQIAGHPTRARSVLSYVDSVMSGLED